MNPAFHFTRLRKCTYMGLIGLWMALSLFPFAHKATSFSLFTQRFSSNNSGLPSNAIQQTITDQDGFLWVATDQGLVRFDGSDWRIWDSTNSPARLGIEIVGLAERGGILYMSPASGRVLFSDQGALARCGLATPGGIALRG
jgi:membrane protein implicated in regulation of membrane protease activity